MIIQFINKTKTSEVHPDDFATAVTAISAQFKQDYCPMWDAAMPTILCGGAVLATAFQLELWEKSDQPGAAGYHWKDAQGKPIGFAFLDAGSWQITMGHEALEMFGDRYCASWVQAGDGKMRAFEMCDAVEEDSYVKTVGNTEVPVTNFLGPAYFSDTPITDAESDFLNKLHGQPAPAMTAGGYDLVIDTSGNPTQEFAKLKGMLAAKHPRKQTLYSRTGRRLHQAARMLKVTA
jgi:hypothetical protein